MTAARLLRWGFVLTLSVAVTGGLVLALPEQGAFVLPLLDAHVILGWAAAVCGPALLGAHLAHTRTPWRAAGLMFGLGVALSLPAIAALDAGVDEDLLGVLQGRGARAMGGDLQALASLSPQLALLVLVAAALVLGIGAQFVPLASHARSRWTGLALTLLAGWATTTGAVLPWVHRDSIFLALGAHSVVGCAAILLGTHHVLASRAARSLASPRRSALAVALGTLVALVAIGGAVRGKRGAPAASSLEVPGVMMASTPATADERQRAVTPGSGWVHLPPEVVRDSMGCGEAGCHAVLTAEWASTPHRYAASNALYRAAVNGLVAEGDMAGVHFCANCHDPDRAITGRVAEDYAHGAPEGGSDGVSCLACHGMVSAQTGPPANGLFTLAAAPAGHLGEGATERRRIARDPRAHRHVLGIDEFVIGPTPCETCHRLELGPEHGVGQSFVLQNQGPSEEIPEDQRVMCQECHLPVMPREFDQYSHRMPGINADLAAYVPVSSAEDAGELERQAMAARNRAGTVPYGPMTAPGWPVEPELSHPAYDDVMEPRPLALRLRVADRGEGLSLRARTLNRRVGHAFPSGPLDLQEVWFEVRVSDAGGQVLVDRGGLDPQGRVRADSPRLGARELGADGLPLREHRLKELTEVLDKRLLGVGGFADDAFPIPVSDEVRFPLDARARWVFRRANPEFVAFAGLDAGAIPPWEIASAHLVIEDPRAPDE